MRTQRHLARLVSVAAVVSLAACGSSDDSTSTPTSSEVAVAASTTAATTASSATASSTTATSPTGAPTATPPAAPGGAPGGGNSDTSAPKGTYTLSSGRDTATGPTYEATDADTSGVLVLGGATLALTDPTVVTSGDSSSSDSSSFYGLDAGILAKGASTVTIVDGTVTTSGDGANGVFAYGEGTSITVTGTTVNATGQYAHGVMASGGGTITATDVTASTTGANSAVIATDRGGGTITVKGGTWSTAGIDSPGLYATGTLTIDGAAVTATGAEAAVIEGSNAITVTDSTLAGRVKSGVMLYQSMSGDATGSAGSFTMTGGSLSQAAGPLFYVTNASGTVTVTGVALTATSGVLLKAAADTWGTSGSNGGHATLTAKDEQLAGDVLVDDVSTAVVNLASGTTLTGTVDAAGTGSVTLTIDASSRWVVTGDSHVTVLTGAIVAGTSVTNIAGNGHTVTYSSADNPALGGMTYTLAGGGTLTPA